MIRIRQIALVAADLDAAISELSTALDTDVIFQDPGVAEFGLHNALFCIGDQFIEIVSPIRTNTTAGRLLEKRGGDGGYMAIYDTDNVDELVAHAKNNGVRFVWEGSVPGIRGHHMHPRDTSGTLV
ncbi:MAG: VOC family protein, partial [Acidimicrobiaceae bacterium]